MVRRELSDDEWELVEPILPIGRFGPCPERLREQFEGVVRRFRTGSQWREMPGEFGPWSTVYDRISQSRDGGVFEALMDGMITEAARREQVDMSVVSVDSTVVRAHHDAAGARVSEEVLTALEKAAGRTKVAPGTDKSCTSTRTAIPGGPNGGGPGVGTGHG